MSIRLGTAIGIVGAILIALVAILCITVKLNEKSSNNKSKYSIEDNRVITKLKNDYKSFQRSTKKIKLNWVYLFYSSEYDWYNECIFDFNFLLLDDPYFLIINIW